MNGTQHNNGNYLNQSDLVEYLDTFELDEDLQLEVMDHDDNHHRGLLVVSPIFLTEVGENKQSDYEDFEDEYSQYFQVNDDEEREEANESTSHHSTPASSFNYDPSGFHYQNQMHYMIDHIKEEEQDHQDEDFLLASSIYLPVVTESEQYHYEDIQDQDYQYFHDDDDQDEHMDESTYYSHYSEPSSCYHDCKEQEGFQDYRMEGKPQEYHGGENEIVENKQSNVSYLLDQTSSSHNLLLQDSLHKLIHRMQQSEISRRYVNQLTNGAFTRFLGESSTI